MSTIRFKGNAKLTAAVQHAQVTAYDAATTYTVTRNGKSITSIAAGSATNVAAALVTAWNASTEPEFAEYTASNSTDTLILTQDTAGNEFGPVTTAESGGTGTIDDFTVVTANSGPSDFDVPATWSGGVVPANSDTVYLSNNTVPMKFSLDQSSGPTTLAVLQVDQSNEADIGLPEVNEDGEPYAEDRPQYLKLGATSLVIGRGPGQGSGRLKIDNSTLQTAIVVENTGSPAESNLEAFLWKGTHASNTMVVGGNASVGVGVFLGDAATLATLTVKDAATVRVGQGVTLAAVVVYGGTVVINCAVSTSIVMYGGTVTVNGTGAVALAQVWGGTLIYNSTGTLGGAPVVGDGALLDFSQDPRAKTVTNAIDVYGTGTVNDPNKVVATLVIDYNGTTPLPNLGTNFRITRAATA